MLSIADIMSPVIGSVIGYFTNWLAIWMLFRPHTEKRLLGVRLPFTPGLIPKERRRLAEKVADTVSVHVLTPEVLAKELSSLGLLGGSGGWLDSTPEMWLTRLGISEPEKVAERFLIHRLSNEQTQTKLSGLVTVGIRGILNETDKGIAALPFKEWAITGWGALRKRCAEEPMSLDGVIPSAFLEAVKAAIKTYLPQWVPYAEKWPAENPVLDEKLAEMVRKIIHEHFGRFIGVFIDHKKIYENIKSGLFTYLNEPENQRFLTDKINEILDGFFAAKIEIENFPDETRLAEWLESSQAMEIFLQPIIYQISLSGWLDTAFPNFDAAIDAFVKNQIKAFIEPNQTEEAAAIRLPALAKKTLSEWWVKFCHTPLKKWAKQLDSPEKKAALGRALEQMTLYIAEQIHVKEMVENKINSFAVDEAETLVRSVVHRELQMITVLGGVLGFLIGFVPIIMRMFIP